MKSIIALLTVAAASLSAYAAPAPSQSKSFLKQNGINAINQNNLFGSLTPSSTCQSNQNACVNQKFAQCTNGRYVLQDCANGLICAAVPKTDTPGTTVTCTTQSNVDSLISATGAQNDDTSSGSSTTAASSSSQTPTECSVSSSSSSTPATSDNSSSNNSGSGDGQDSGSDNGSGNDNGGGDGSNNNDGSDGSGDNNNDGSNNDGSDNGSSGSNNNDGSDNGSGDNNGGSNDPQSSLCLEPNLVQTGFEQNGQETPAAGQVASLTSSNNYINFCGTVSNVTLTNGQQVKGGSCNAAPMGLIASVNNMPSAKFLSPANLDTVQANTNFTVKLQINHLTTGNFVNADANYFSAPQQVDPNGDILGHSHIVIEAVSSLTATDVLDPTKFTFFKGLNDPADNGVLSATVTGLPEGTYRMASINTAANHQPALVAVAQHGSLDDMIYFTVTASGQPDNNNNNAANNNNNGGGNGKGKSH